MESRLLAVFAFLLLVVVVCDAALPSELYWNQMLLGIPMPRAVRELLQPGNIQKTINDGKQPDSNSALNNAGDQSDHFPFFYKGGKQSDLYKGGKQSDHFPFFYKGGKQSDPNYFAGKQSDHFHFFYKGGKQSDPNYFAAKQSDHFPLFYNYVSSKAEVGDHDSIFFLERDLNPGRKIKVNLRRTTMWTNFLPRQLAESIPFSTDKVTQIMEMFSIKSQSPEVNVFKETIKNCEDAPLEGEEKHCATSLESMVDFVVYKLGKNVQSLSTEIGMSRQQYASVERVGGSNSIVCHSQTYAYPVFHCHATQSTKVYKLPLYTNGNKYAIIAVCHMDTSKWDPEHIAFEVLNVKPGTAAVCHFLPEGDIVWTSGETST